MRQLAGRDTEYVVDSFPVASCHPVRSFVSKLFSGEEFRGYNASKKQWFFGLKVHVVAAQGKRIVDFVISPACEHDLTGLKVMNPKLSNGSYLFGDKAYTDYEYEEKLASQGIQLVAERKKNSKRSHPSDVDSKRQRVRKRIESLFSDILKKFPRFLKAVTEAGFELKITLFLVAQSLLSAINGN